MKFLNWLTEHPAESEDANARATLVAVVFGIFVLVLHLAIS